MIAAMRKLHLAALVYDRDRIFDALERTHAVEVKERPGESAELPETAELKSYLASLGAALSALVSAAEESGKEGKASIPQDGFKVTYAEFSEAAAKKEEIDRLAEEVRAAVGEKNEIPAERARLSRALAAALPYAAAGPFDSYADTRFTKTCLGLLPSAAWPVLKERLSDMPLADVAVVSEEDPLLLAVTAHRSAAAEAEALLAEAGFTVCPYAGPQTGAEKIAAIREELRALEARERAADEKLRSMTPSIRSLKIFCDYVAFELEKRETAAALKTTERTFLLEAFVPAEAEEEVKSALEGTMSAVWYEFSDPSEDEAVPTLLKNNKVVENFELITNMYSPPNARELDPNAVMSFFYSLFMGFIMADIGYGLLMAFGGGFLYWKNREKGGGLKSLSGVFAVSGIFAIVWGFLFNSLFGIALLPFTVMPNVQTAMYTVMGIGLPAVLVVSLMLGVVQLMAGYLCKAVLSWKRGSVWDGIFDGVVWAVFSLGVELALIGLVEEFALSGLTAAGGIVAGVSLVIAMLTAGRKQKFFGKITKGFGCLYGLINYFSDVLSYLRLYALMLTGAIIAQVVSQYSVQFLTSGSVLVVLGPILMVVGHVFNLAISLLGAYIHTARLQYIEFFGKFYEGDGELFTPLGSAKKHIVLENKLEVS